MGDFVEAALCNALEQYSATGELPTADGLAQSLIGSGFEGADLQTPYAQLSELADLARLADERDRELYFGFTAGMCEVAWLDA